MESCAYCGSRNIEALSLGRYICHDCDREFTDDELINEYTEKELEDGEESGEIDTSEAAFYRGFEKDRKEKMEG